MTDTLLTVSGFEFQASGFALTDCHCHLQDERFDHDLPEVMARAERVGVRRFVCNGSAQSDWEKTVHIARDDPKVVPCLGLHPLHVQSSRVVWPEYRRQVPSVEWLGMLTEMITNASRPTASCTRTPVGIGEIGLDHYVTPRDDALQEQVFREQLLLATRLGKPVMLHTRNSLDRVIEILSEKGVDIPFFLLHGFGSSTDRVDRIVKMGGYFSFSANILKTNHKKTRYAAATVPLDRILLESDAPDMPPPELFPRNEPVILPAVLDELARLRNMPVGELAAVIAENETTFFEKW